MANEKERLHHSRFPDSGVTPDFELPDNAESALLRNIVNREVCSKLKRKSQAFKLNFPLIGRVQTFPEPGKKIK